MDAISALSPLTQNLGLPGTGALGNLGLASARALGGSSLLGFNYEMMAMQSSMLQLLAQLMVGQSNQQMAQLAKGLASAGGNSPVGSSGGSTGSSSSSGSSGASTGSSGASSANASAQPKDQGEIDSFIQSAAAAYGADPKVLKEIARRESNFKADAVNNWDSNAKKGTPSKGMFQFIEPTFKSMAPKAKAANPKAWEGLGELNWMDWRQQALVCAWAIANGQGSHWATYNAAKSTAHA
jgi:hypothetical protein